MAGGPTFLKRAALEMQQYLELIGQVGRGLVTRPIYGRDIIEQLDAIGIGSLTVVLLTGTFTGMVLALQSGQSLDQFGGRSMVGRLVSASMVKELGPVLTALMVTGRVGSGIAAELGSMVVTDQIAALRALGTDPIRKLVVPRVLAGVIMVPILTIISDAVGLMGGALISRVSLHVAGSVYWNNATIGLYPQDLWMGVLKPIVLGFCLVTIGCHVGLGTTGGTQGVGRATTHAVVAGSVAVLAVDFLITKLLIATMFLIMTPLTPLIELDAPRPVANARGTEPVIAFENVSLAFDDKVILDGVSFALLPGHMKIVLGASGAGKSTILRLVLGLLKPDGGSIIVNGQRVDAMRERDLMKVRAGVGMVFQEGALFDSFTVRENVGYRLFEESTLPISEVDARVDEVLGYVGLQEYRDRMPSELSGGQRRRVAIARALTAKPGILLYDEPTTGLDPITALTIDTEIIKLRDLDEVSSMLVTHQLRDAFYIADHHASRSSDALTFEPAPPARQAMTTFLMLKEGKIVFEGPAAELRDSTDAYLRSFLS